MKRDYINCPSKFMLRLRSIWLDALRPRILPAAGPFAVSGGNLIVSILSVRHLVPVDYGALSFIIIVVQFTAGLSNALVVTPLTAGSQRAVNLMLGKGLAQAGWINAVASGILLVIISLAINVSIYVALAAGLLAVVQNFRWTCRGYALAHDNILLAFRSDIILSLFTVGGAVLLTVLGKFTLLSAVAVIVLASFISFSIVPSKWLIRPIHQISHYKDIWLTQSRWSLLGVISTEAVSNAFSYTITAIAGTSAFAPIAFASLFWRPFNVCVSALTPVERMKAIRQINANATDFPPAIRELSIVLIIIVIGTASGSFLVLPFAIKHLTSFNLSVTIEAMIAMSAAMAARSVREPLGILWQAQGRFRPLSIAISVAGVLSVLMSIAICLSISSALAPLSVAIGECGLAAYLFCNRWENRRGPRV